MIVNLSMFPLLRKCCNGPIVQVFNIPLTPQTDLCFNASMLHLGQRLVPPGMIQKLIQRVSQLNSATALSRKQCNELSDKYSFNSLSTWLTRWWKSTNAPDLPDYSRIQTVNPPTNTIRETESGNRAIEPPKHNQANATRQISEWKLKA